MRQTFDYQGQERPKGADRERRADIEDDKDDLLPIRDGGNNILPGDSPSGLSSRHFRLGEVEVHSVDRMSSLCWGEDCRTEVRHRGYDIRTQQEGRKDELPTPCGSNISGKDKEHAERKEQGNSTLCFQSQSVFQHFRRRKRGDTNRSRTAGRHFVK
jgi:hypothetical protein